MTEGTFPSNPRAIVYTEPGLSPEEIVERNSFHYLIKDLKLEMNMRMTFSSMGTFQDQQIAKDAAKYYVLGIFFFFFKNFTSIMKQFEAVLSFNDCAGFCAPICR